MDDQNEYNQLIELILSGNKQAYGELYEKTIQDVYKTVHFLIEDKDDVDDLVQDIYIQVYKSLRKYDRDRQFKPWLMGIVIKQAQAYRRKRWVRLRIAKKAEEYEQATVLDFSNDIIDKITNQQLVNLVNELPYKLKQVIILRYLNGYSQEEVARILEIPLGTVKSRIHSALNKLRVKGKNKNFSFKESEECI
ncbi:RNA polymerase sigma-70 factor (ECF subfamily) [Thermolongibacillus altinsuensis]|jgi:RNA polymerase sigma-70 factor (ECF subfamily)|uniref:RNA polymerase sigma-70 factor (ECF subfamily) n=1 Tax=Thermolongibacillus altinsuensis TaxID=575256 RepID=A0A4R1QE28_9BACL|nr:sigma-70 family RNA polymerase sigma factor [Thermolongibacillus altinsuensis]TCL49329.1 RNA polymerase sigma-70 factor (ECF subfamily) [Thermolongibacillus altinsuensis]GMB10143.1 RNA polymerase sigma factor [Thermolongibacillus altinsuensis]